MKFRGWQSVFERWSSSRLSSVLALGSALLVTAAATAYVWFTATANDQRRFENAIQHTRDAIHERVKIHLALLRGAAALVAANPSIAEEEFEAYIELLRLEKNYPGVEGIGYAKRVTAAERADFVRRMRERSRAGFKIHPAGEREEYYPIIYLRPKDFKEEIVKGFDLFTEPLRRRTMLQARDTGRAATSEKLTLMREGAAAERQGFVVYVPIFDGERPPKDLWERRKALTGFVLGGFRNAELFSGVFQSETRPPVHFDVYDGVLTRPERLLYSSRGAVSGEPLLSTAQRLDVPGHIWTLAFETTPAFHVASGRRWAFWILGVGVATSLLLYLAVDALGRAQRRAAANLERVNLELERKVNERTGRLQESIADLEHFSYSITHDMRAPLRAIQGYAQLVAQDPEAMNPSVRHEYLRRIAAATERMDKLIRDSLNYAKIVREEMDVEPLSPERILREMLESYPAFQRPKAEVRLEGEFPMVLANEAGLTQCFSNLLGNAVKFVPKGKTPRVKIRAERRDGVVRIWFEDNGIGIPEESRERIFGMFQRLHRNEEYEGTGIGLAMVRKVMTRMGGRVGVESEPGQGSRFWLELRAAEEGQRDRYEFADSAVRGG